MMYLSASVCLIIALFSFNNFTESTSKEIGMQCTGGMRCSNWDEVCYNGAVCIPIPESEKSIIRKRSINRKHRHDSHSGSRPTRIYDDVKQLIAPKEVTQQESQSHQPAGQENANIINCNRCYKEKGDLVCGDNGVTYISLCHAMNCGELKRKEVKPGACETKNPCKNNDCLRSEVCLPNAKGPCFSLYNTFGQKVSCRLYSCASKQICTLGLGNNEVCGENGKTYISICKLHKANIKFAYTGVCRPDECSREVCGGNGITYMSECHAISHYVRVDYNGICFSDKDSIKASSCSEIQNAGRCLKLACSNSVSIIPKGSCCPVCGGSFIIYLNPAGLANSPRNNDFRQVKSFIHKFIPLSALTTCKMSAVLIKTNIISVTLEAIEPENAQQCMSDSYDMIEIINKVSAGQIMVKSNIAKHLQAQSMPNVDDGSTINDMKKEGSNRPRTFVDSGACDCCWPTGLVTAVITMMALLIMNVL